MIVRGSTSSVASGPAEPASLTIAASRHPGTSKPRQVFFDSATTSLTNHGTLTVDADATLDFVNGGRRWSTREP